MPAAGVAVTLPYICKKGARTSFSTSASEGAPIRLLGRRAALRIPHFYPPRYAAAPRAAPHTSLTVINYSDIVGQREVINQLRAEVASGRTAHARLLCGAEGVGKLPVALAFAHALLCEHPQGGEACNACPSCLMLRRWVHPDLHYVFPVVNLEGKTNTLCDDYLPQWLSLLNTSAYFGWQAWLEHMGAKNKQAQIGVAESNHLIERLSMKASRGGRKVVVIWRPELMNAAAANKLLKLLEEPPAGTVFLLASEQPERLLDTVVSRTQRIDLRPIAVRDIATRLEEERAIDEDAASAIARQSEGSYTRALSLIRASSDAGLFFDLFKQLMRLGYQRRVKELWEWSNTLAEWGREQQKHFLDFTQRMIRENFAYNFHRPELCYQSAEEAQFSVAFSPFINERNVFGLMQELDSAARDIEQNTNARMVFFDLALNTIVLLRR